MGIKLIETSIPDSVIRQYAKGLTDTKLRKYITRCTYYICSRYFWAILLAAQAGATLRCLVYFVRTDGDLLSFVIELALYLFWLNFYRRQIIPPYRIAIRDVKFFKEEFNLRQGRLSA